MRNLGVRESAPLSAHDVTGHGQKDLARISQGLDIYFNFFCQVKCVICSSYEQSGPGGAVAFEWAEKRWKSKHTLVDVTREHATLHINQMNLFMTCWWHVKKNAYTYFFHPSKLFELCEGSVSMVTRVGCVCFFCSWVCVFSSTCCILRCSRLERTAAE